MSSIADEYLKADIKNILTNGQKDENPRPKYEDGTPAYTYFVTHNVRTYDLSKSEFPITTLRPIAWKNAIKEVLWIYQDASNNLDILEDKYNIHWWNSWESQDIPGTIGNRYGHTVARYDLMNKRVLDDIKKEVYGEIGTPRRDKIEAELANLRIGLQIRNAREARKLTQSQLAQKIGKERSFISKVEREGSNLTLSTLYDIVTKGLGGKLDIRVQV